MQHMQIHILTLWCPFLVAVRKQVEEERVSDLDKESSRWHFDRLVLLLQTHSITRNVTEINHFLARVRVCRDAATIPPRRSAFCFH